MTTGTSHPVGTPSGSGPAEADVLAAGAVLWRVGADGPEVALVHRPRYDDWSFPKGKLDHGESMPFAAAREVGEETGCALALGAVLGDARYTVVDGRKRVRYWSARARGGSFVPNAETDELRWLSPERAAVELSYDYDRDVLVRFTELGPPTSVLAVVRHAKAGSRSRWEGEDALRPLSENGRHQARQLAALLHLFGPDRVVSAPPLRCRDTVVPTAQAMAVPIGDEPLLGEERYWDAPEAGQARLLELAAQPSVTVVCSQGGVIPDAVGALAAAAGLPGIDPDDVPARKASTWVLTFDGRALRSADYYSHPTG